MSAADAAGDAAAAFAAGARRAAHLAAASICRPVNSSWVRTGDVRLPHHLHEFFLRSGLRSSTLSAVARCGLPHPTHAEHSCVVSIHGTHLPWTAAKRCCTPSGMVTGCVSFSYAIAVQFFRLRAWVHKSHRMVAVLASRHQSWTLAAPFSSCGIVANVRLQSVLAVQWQWIRSAQSRHSSAPTARIQKAGPTRTTTAST